MYYIKNYITYKMTHLKLLCSFLERKICSNFRTCLEPSAVWNIFYSHLPYPTRPLMYYKRYKYRIASCHQTFVHGNSAVARFLCLDSFPKESCLNLRNVPGTIPLCPNLQSKLGKFPLPSHPKSWQADIYCTAVYCSI